MQIVFALVVELSNDAPWPEVTALATAVLALVTMVAVIVAIFAYSAAKRQVAAALDGTRESRRISKIERTADLLTEFGSDKMESLFGFFDVAYECANSRAAIRELYEALIVSQRGRIIKASEDLAEEKRRRRPIDDALTQLYLELDHGISRHKPSIAEIADTDRASELKRRIIAISNRCERAWVLIDNDVVDSSLFFATQDYNILATYYILEDALKDLTSEEAFDFDLFRQLAIRAQMAYRLESDPDDTLTDAEFEKFPE